MSAVFIEARAVQRVDPRATGYGNSGPALRIELDMSEAQIKAAIVGLIGNHMGEQQVYEWLRGEFPEWFEVTA